VLALTGKTNAADTIRVRLLDMRRHAPHLIDAGVGNVLRRHQQAGRITTREADRAGRVAARLIDHHYPHIGPLARRAWSLRQNLSFYDALYVALASYLDVPLLTVDKGLSRTPGLPCEIQLV
jgi:predicted nucleic acid-binding protein